MGSLKFKHVNIGMRQLYALLCIKHVNIGMSQLYALLCIKRAGSHFEQF